MRVVYDLTKPPMNRVVKAEVRCTNCTVPDFEPLNDNQLYKIALTSFMAGGGDGYSMFRDNRTSLILTAFLDSEILTTYIGKLSPISIGIEGRIRFVNSTSMSTPATNSPCVNSASTPNLISSILIVTISIISLLLF